MKVAVVGATGLVGTVMLKVLAERNFPISELILVASERSKGKIIQFQGKDYSIRTMAEALAAAPDLALFSAGGETSKEWAPKFAAAGAVVVDNSSTWRLDNDKKLIVPEVNGHLLTNADMIIANPNCSTIQMVVALAPLHAKYGLKRLVISTYQSFTGTGVKAVKQYQLERKGYEAQANERAYSHPIFENCLPHCDVFLENDYTKEEMKLVHETRKIMSIPALPVTATAVRVPVPGGHSESVNAEFSQGFEMEEVRNLLQEAPGVTVVDSPADHAYPMPLTAKDKDDVFVGRLRRDESIDNGLNLWIVSDNLRKGAATNAIQIAELLVQKKLLPLPVMA